MCSDGLSGLVHDRRICDVCLTMPFKDVVPDSSRKQENGGDDNITVLFMQLRFTDRDFCLVFPNVVRLFNKLNLFYRQI